MATCEGQKGRRAGQGGAREIQGSGCGEVPNLPRVPEEELSGDCSNLARLIAKKPGQCVSVPLEDPATAVMGAR